MSTSYHMANGNLSVHLPLMLGGGTGFWKFGILLGGQKILFFSRDCPNRGHIYFLGGSRCSKNVFFVVFSYSLIFTFFHLFLLWIRGLLFISQFVCLSIKATKGRSDRTFETKISKAMKIGGRSENFRFQRRLLFSGNLIFKGEVEHIGNKQKGTLFSCYAYVMLMLLLQDLSTVYLVDHLLTYRYIIWIKRYTQLDSSVHSSGCK